MENKVREQIISLLKEFRSNINCGKFKNAGENACDFIALYKNINDTVDILEVERASLYYAGVNGAGSNKKKIESKIQDCNMALFEYERYQGDKTFKELYNRFGIDVLKHDTAFEMYVKRLIKFNGDEKNMISGLFDKNVYDYLNLKQMKLSQVLKDFKLNRNLFIKKVK